MKNVLLSNIRRRVEKSSSVDDFIVQEEMDSAVAHVMFQNFSRFTIYDCR